MADTDEKPLVRKEGSVSSTDEKDDEKPSEMPQVQPEEGEYVSDSGGAYNDDEEGGCEDMAHMPEGEVIESGDGDDDEETAESGGRGAVDDDHDDDNDDGDGNDHNRELHRRQEDDDESGGAVDVDNDEENGHDVDEQDDAKACGSDYVEEGEEREEGDGEEGYGEEGSHVTITTKDKVLDFDEDRRNPQYIPKKGGFYEHDDRLGEEEAASVEAPGVEDEKNKAAKKKLWKAEGRWKHDFFQDDEQSPKGRDELIATYGYDIRNEDGPPRARRRRRYGRGPMKYTRNWEDENAYGKPGGSQRSGDGDDERSESFRGGYRERRGGRDSGYRGGRSGRGRANRGSSNRRDYENQQNDRSRDSYRSVELVSDRDKALDEGYEGFAPAKSDEYPDLPGRNESRQPQPQPPPSSSSQESTGYAGRGRASSRRNYASIHRNRGGNDSPKNNESRPPVVVVNDETSRTNQELLSGFKKLSVHADGEAHQTPSSAPPTREGRKEAKIAPTQHNASGMPHERRQATVPPRLQDSTTNRPKRYSSQRQRQGGDSAQPDNYQQQSSGRLHDGDPPSMPQSFYEPSYQHPVYSDTVPTPTNVQQHGSSGGPAAAGNIMPHQHYQAYDAPYPDTYAIRPMANPPSRAIFNPVSLAAAAAANGQQQQQPPSVIPAPYIPATGGNIMSYGPPPPPAYPPPQYHHHHQQQYAVSQFVPAAPPPPVSQTQEIFHCGMAFYNAPPPVTTLPKRRRAAIPIVPPPEMEDQRKDGAHECNVTTEHCEQFSSEQTVNVDN